MTKREKLVDRIRARPPDADADDVIALLEDFGWTLKRQKGSHMIFVKDGAFPLSVPLVSGRRVKRTYLTKICELLGLDD